MNARRRTLSLAVIAMAMMVCPPAEHARRGGIEPGPAVMSEEESALEADPAKGIEHALILVEETWRAEDQGTATKTAFHMRAKILSNEGRALANIEIPFPRKGGKLKQFWGRTILPGGTVHELRKDDLDRQVVVKAKRAGVEVAKAALPGVVPGCVIDYGYVLQHRGYYLYERIPLQRSFPILRFEYHWKPYPYMYAASRLSRTDLLDVTSDKSRGALHVTGRNLPPVIEEPLMPPDHEVRGALVVYYVSEEFSYDRFWTQISTFMDLFVLLMTAKPVSVERAMNEMELSGDVDQIEGLMRAYEWIGDNLKRTGLRTFEELQAGSIGSDEGDDVIARVLDSREGSSVDLQLLFIAVARKLGAKAHLVFASDRRNNYWHESLKTMNQFDGTLVAVRPEGAEKYTPLDPGSGLRYGELPWWYAGQKALLLAMGDPGAISLPATAAQNNVADATVKIRFTEDNESTIAEWTRVGTGQVGLEERRYLRSLAPDERAERIDRLCGAGPDTEVVTAEVVGLDEVTHGLELRCESEDFDVSLFDETTSYRVGFDGPWLSQLPDLPEGARHHPVVFDFARADTVSVDIIAPEGFVPADPPSPQTIENSLGKYMLRVSRDADRFSIERALALFNIEVRVDRYDDLRAFIVEVERLDRTQLSFVRSETAR
jgi:hypothetical protein